MTFFFVLSLYNPQKMFQHTNITRLIKTSSGHRFVLFHGKFTDKYNSFIQYFNTHMISFSQYFSCFSARLPVCLPIWKYYVWVYLNRAQVSEYFHHTTGTTVTGHDSQSHRNRFLFVLHNFQNDGSCLNHGFHSLRCGESPFLIFCSSSRSPRPALFQPLAPPHSERFDHFSVSTFSNGQNRRRKLSSLAPAWPGEPC